MTLYGIVDAGINYVNNSGGEKAWTTSSGIAQGSRWGLRGAEDLGGGLKAVFQLENGFNVFNGRLGQGGLEFGRQAYVGISSEQFGTITVGRQYDPVVEYVQPITLNGNGGAFFSHAGDIDNTNNAFRVNNSVKYTSPSIGGLKFGGMYAFGGVAGQFGRNSTAAAGVSYSAGPVSLGAAYFYAKNPAAQFVDGNWAANTPTPSTHGAFGYVGNPSNMQTIAVGGTYKIGAATLGLDYTNVRFDDANGTTSSVHFNNYEAWGQYMFTPAATLALGYTFTDGNVNYSGAKPKYNQFNLLADYWLSKRTDVYLMGVYQHTSGGALADIYDGLVGAQSTTNSQVVARVGIRHKF